MKAYMVEITTHAVVMADDETHAYAVAESYKHEALRDDVNPLVEVECEVTRLEDLKHSWDGECIPYGGDGNTRLNAILSHRPAAVDGAMVERALNARYNGYDVACYIDEEADGRGVICAALTAALAAAHKEEKSE